MIRMAMTLAVGGAGLQWSRVGPANQTVAEWPRQLFIEFFGEIGSVRSCNYYVKSNKKICVSPKMRPHDAWCTSPSAADVDWVMNRVSWELDEPLRPDKYTVSIDEGAFCGDSSEDSSAAIRWSFKVPEASPQRKRVAVLITGEMRAPLADPSLKRFGRYAASLGDIFVSTYVPESDAEQQALKTFEKHHATVLLVQRHELSRYNPSSIRQWALLDRLVSSYFRSPIETKHDVLLRIRTDLRLWSHEPEQVLDELQHVEAGFVYARSDLTFYATAATFANVFGDFLSSICNKYLDANEAYVPLNFSNIMASDAVALEMHVQSQYPAVAKTEGISGIKRPRTGATTQTLVVPCRAMRTEKIEMYRSISNTAQISLGATVSFATALRAWIRRGDANHEGPYCNTDGSPADRFGSEKFMLLHVLRKVPLKACRLPFLGVAKLRVKLPVKPEQIVENQRCQLPVSLQGNESSDAIETLANQRQRKRAPWQDQSSDRPRH